MKYTISKSLLKGEKLHYQCPGCSTELESPLSDAGKSDTCPMCSKPFTVPGIEALKARKVLAEAKQKEKEEQARKREQERAERQRQLPSPIPPNLPETLPVRVKRVVPEVIETSIIPSEETKPCPYCGESILLAAKKCKHCGEMLDKKLRAEANRQTSVIVAKQSPGCLSSFLKLGLVGVAVLVIGTCLIINRALNHANRSEVSQSKALNTPSEHVPAELTTPIQQPPIANSVTEMPKEQTHKMGDTVSIGYTTYCVWSAEWRPSVGSGYLIQKPNASFLVLNLTVRNNDTKARTIPPLHLVDDEGREYDSSSATMMMGDSAFNVIEDLNPSVSKQGDMVFDVPKGRKYKLKVSGGFWSAEEAVIQIDAR